MINNKKIHDAIIKASHAFNNRKQETETDHLWLTYLSSVVPKHKIAYFSVPKNACTSLKVLMCRLNGKTVPKDLSLIHLSSIGLTINISKFLPETIYTILTSPKWFRFYVVRNPYSRLLSAYKNKIAVSGKEMDFDILRKRIVEKYGLNEKRDKISFFQFVKWIEESKCMNIHWNLQVKLLRVEFVNCSMIVRFENFEKDMEEFFRRTKITPLPIEITNKTNSTKMSEFYNQELADIVYEIYQPDFKRFGYHRDSWKTE